eukprot:6164-Eustigmatos_ZCMA.PRE.1
MKALQSALNNHVQPQQIKALTLGGGTSHALADANMTQIQKALEVVLVRVGDVVERIVANVATFTAALASALRKGQGR